MLYLPIHLTVVTSPLMCIHAHQCHSRCCGIIHACAEGVLHEMHVMLLMLDMVSSIHTHTHKQLDTGVTTGSLQCEICCILYPQTRLVCQRCSYAPLPVPLLAAYECNLAIDQRVIPTTALSGSLASNRLPACHMHLVCLCCCHKAQNSLKSR